MPDASSTRAHNYSRRIEIVILSQVVVLQLVRARNAAQRSSFEEFRRKSFSFNEIGKIIRLVVDDWGIGSRLGFT